MQKVSTKEIEIISNSWLLIIAIAMPFCFYPINGTFNAYVPRFIMLSFLGLLFLPFFIVNARFFLLNETKGLDIKFLLLYYVMLIISTYFASDKFAAVIGYKRLDGLFIMLIYLMIFFVARKVKIISRKAVLAILFVACIISIHA
ncbi:MAG: hypothetical protein K0M69_16260, partial [Youngiibacter sp.]|nr:hypothetical protein [Youngiibacter sp.]